MRYIQKAVMGFDELGDKEKAIARIELQSVHGYVFEKEAMASLEALANHFSAKLSDWEVDWAGNGSDNFSHAHFDTGYMEHSEKELEQLIDELGSYNPETLMGVGECVLTGVCHDEDAIDGLRRAWHSGVRDVGHLLQAGFRSWLKACQADYENFYEDKNLAEYCNANEYEFYANGEIY